MVPNRPFCEGLPVSSFASLAERGKGRFGAGRGMEIDARIRQRGTSLRVVSQAYRALAGGVGRDGGVRWGRGDAFGEGGAWDKEGTSMVSSASTRSSKRVVPTVANTLISPPRGIPSAAE